jgi:Chaperone for flagella basal body P-ring formation
MTSATPTRQASKLSRRSAALCVGLLLGPGLFASDVAFAQSGVRPLVEGSAAHQETFAAQGWVLREVHWDPILQHAWEVFADPAHPERPTVAVLAGGAEQQLARSATEAHSRVIEAAVPVVHIGDRVVLWSAEKNLRLQLAAVAEENGAIGDHIRLSIPGAAWDNGPSSQQPVRGVVRGVADVEIEP